MLPVVEKMSCDVLVIGGGLAGLRAAIEARKHGADVAIVSESRVGFGNNSAVSGASFAAAGIGKEPGDSPQAHCEDTVIAGRFVNDRRLVETLARGAARQVHDMAGLGVGFAGRAGEPLIRHAAGHSFPRHVYDEAHRGYNFTKPMREHALRTGVRLIEGILIARLLRAEDMLVGAVGMDSGGNGLIIGAKSTVLATGGAGQVFLRTNNAVGLTGDGYALASEAGATLRDMEFIQFYPTALGEHGRRNWTYGQFVKEGAVIRNALGKDILEKHGLKDFNLMTRDMVARATMIEITEGRGIDGALPVDMSGIPAAKFEKLRPFVQSRHYPEAIRVAPTVHYFMGGVRTNQNAETEIDGLYAAGEVCGGLHGANRLDGNAIAEALVFGAIAGREAAARSFTMQAAPDCHREATAVLDWLYALSAGNGRESLGEVRRLVKQVMWDKAGVLRNGKALERALAELLALGAMLARATLSDRRQLPQVIKLGNMILVAEMVCRAALMRTESRGAHCRTDYPEEENERWLNNIEVSGVAGEMSLKITPVVPW